MSKENHFKWTWIWGRRRENDAKRCKHFHHQITIKNIEVFAISIITKWTVFWDILLSQSCNIVFLETGFILVKLNHIHLIISLSLAEDLINLIVTGGKSISSVWVTHFSLVDTADGCRNKSQCARMHYFFPQWWRHWAHSAVTWAKFPGTSVDIVSWTLILSDITVTFLIISMLSIIRLGSYCLKRDAP